MMRKLKAKGTFVQRLAHIKAIIQKIWALSLVNAKQVRKEVGLIQSGAWSAGSWSEWLLGTHQSCLCAVEMLQHNSHPEAEAASVCRNISGIYFFISFQEMGWR